MCYGDPEYGRDGYYREWLQEQEEIHRQEQQEILEAAREYERSIEHDTRNNQ
jgi:hypothetical protein